MIEGDFNYTPKTVKEKGICLPNGEFESDRQIKRKLALEGQTTPVFEDSKFPRDLNTYLDIADKRAKEMAELSPIHETARVSVAETSIINIMSDVHIGNPNVDISRFKQELEVIMNTPNSYILFTGDLVDGIFWGGVSGGEQSLNLSEQHGFLRSLFTSLKGKVIAGLSGEHDSKWASKTGSDPYDIMEEITGAPYLRGIAEIELNVGDQLYKIVAQHRARGFSMYNKNHPTYRESRFDLQGGDVYISAHTHKKQIAQETIRNFGGSTLVTHVSTGTYKNGDEYGDREGYAHQKPEEMFGAAIRLHADKKLVEVNYDILEAGRKW